jgi:hypothetical protein
MISDDELRTRAVKLLAMLGEVTTDDEAEELVYVAMKAVQQNALGNFSRTQSPSEARRPR